jgi:hypothetical protein
VIVEDVTERKRGQEALRRQGWMRLNPNTPILQDPILKKNTE